MSEQHTERELDEIRDEQVVNLPQLNAGPTGSSDTPAKRGRGRPKGSKNKKTIDALTGSIAPGSSSTASQPGEKRKRGRPPKVPYHLQFTDPSIIHDAIQSQEAADAASGKANAKKPRGRPPKNPKSQQTEQNTSAPGAPSASGQDVQGDEAGGLAKRMRTDGNE